MTQVKGKKMPPPQISGNSGKNELSKQQIDELKNTPQINFRGDFFKLSVDEQVAVTNFFSLHNAAVWIHGKLSKNAQDFVQKCIMFSAEKEQLEKERPVTPSAASDRVQFGG